MWLHASELNITSLSLWLLQKHIAKYTPCPVPQKFCTSHLSVSLLPNP